jgi:hypothetical protein
VTGAALADADEEDFAEECEDDAEECEADADTPEVIGPDGVVVTEMTASRLEIARI